MGVGYTLPGAQGETSFLLLVAFLHSAGLGSPSAPSEAAGSSKSVFISLRPSSVTVQ